MASYAAVGLSDASVVRADPAPLIAGVEFGSVVLLRYTLQESEMLALVGLYETGDLRFIVTAIDQAQAYQHSEQEIREILYSFSYYSDSSLSVSSLSQNPSASSHLARLQHGSLDLYLLIVGVLVVGGALFVLVRASRS